MHGNFDGTGTLGSSGANVTVSGWVCWAGTAGEPSTCKVTVEVKQTSGPGSAKAEGTSVQYSKPPAPGAHVQWTATATSSGHALGAGTAEAEAWIKDSQGHTVFKWPASPPLELS
jgi:hypothetical protein